jgi:hypothetical protein
MILHGNHASYSGSVYPNYRYSSGYAILASSPSKGKRFRVSYQRFDCGGGQASARHKEG